MNPGSTKSFLIYIALLAIWIISHHIYSRISLRRWRLQLERNFSVRFFCSGKWQTGKIEAFVFNDTMVKIRFYDEGIPRSIILSKNALLPIRKLK